MGIFFSESKMIKKKVDIFTKNDLWKIKFNFFRFNVWKTKENMKQ